MDSEKIYLLGITKDELSEIIASTFSERFRDFKPTSTVDEKKPLSVQEAAEFLGIAKQSVYNGTSTGVIPHHKQGNKLFFFREELLAWIRNAQHGSNHI